MKYVVIKTGGKQYKVSEGDVLEVERLPLATDQTATFSDVLLYTADDVVRFGQPVVAGITVEGKVVANIRGKKIRVAKYKAKVRYRKVHGHRQDLSQVRIESIYEGAKPAAKKEEKKQETHSAGSANSLRGTSEQAKAETVEAVTAKPAKKPVSKKVIKK